MKDIKALRDLSQWSQREMVNDLPYSRRQINYALAGNQRVRNPEKGQQILSDIAKWLLGKAEAEAKEKQDRADAIRKVAEPFIIKEAATEEAAASEKKS